MKTSALVVALLGALLALPSAAHADEPLTAAMIGEHEASVVTVKYVLNLQMSMGGQTQEREISGEATGVLVDATGLVVLPGNVLNPHARGPGGRQLDIKSTPSNIRVVFPGDAKEYESVLAATDSKIGLAFVRIKDLEGREVKPVDLAGEGEVKLGDRLYGVSRLDQSFDYAPWCDSVLVVGQITKPRKAWIVRGGFTEIGHPLFKADGTVAGFIVAQEGVGGGRALPFLLPLKVARATVERAAKQAEGILEDVAEEEQEPAPPEGE